MVSILDQEMAHWLGQLTTEHTQTVLRFAYHQLQAVADAEIDEWTKDRVDMQRLGIHGADRARWLRLAQIAQPWLREVTRRWVRHSAARNQSAGTLANHVHAARELSSYLAALGGPSRGGAEIDRRVLEGFVAHLAVAVPHPATRNKRIGGVRTLLEACRRFDWAPIRPTAIIDSDDYAIVPEARPRAFSSFVMAQLGSEDNLALLAEDGTRTIVIVLLRTGLRVTDVLRLPFDPITYDPAGAPYLDFHIHKLRKDHRIPIDAVTEQTIRRQQAHARSRFPDGTPWLLPRLIRNPTGTHPFTYATLRARLLRWAASCELIDEAGQTVPVTAHRFRHTLATQMINEGVPQHVIQRLYGHESAEMTAVYARLSDQTLRTTFDEWSSKRVDIHGRVVLHDPADEASWLKERLARAKQTLPNGYCGRPLQQACPHPNACLTCEDFLTDGQFLDHHHDQLNRTRKLIAAGEASGNQRLVEMNQRVEISLTQVIASIKKLEAGS